jgi:hypothetical protein
VLKELKGVKVYHQGLQVRQDLRVLRVLQELKVQ